MKRDETKLATTPFLISGTPPSSLSVISAAQGKVPREMRGLDLVVSTTGREGSREGLDLGHLPAAVIPAA